MEAEYQRFVDSITDKMESAGDHEKKALRDLLDYERGIHKDRVDAFRQAEEEKSAEAKRSADRQIESIIKPLEAERDRLQEEMQSVASRTQGAGLMVSGLSRVGGSMGGERPGLMLVDKQLKVAYEQARIQGEIRDTERQILIAVQKGDNDGGGSAGDIF